MAKLTDGIDGRAVRKYLVFGSALLICGIIGRVTAPVRIEKKEVVKVEYVDRVEIKTVERKVYVAQTEKQRRTETTKTTAKTGEVTEKTVVIEGESSKFSETLAKEETSKKETFLESKTEKSVSKSAAPRYLVGATLSIDNTYGGLLGYRVAGPLWVLGSANLSGQASVGVALSF